MIEAEIYGMIPSAKIEAWEKKPPANISYKPSKEFVKFCITIANAERSTPGTGTIPPKRYTSIRRLVKISFFRKSGILKIFKNLSIINK